MSSYVALEHHLQYNTSRPSAWCSYPWLSRQSTSPIRATGDAAITMPNDITLSVGEIVDRVAPGALPEMGERLLVKED